MRPVMTKLREQGLPASHHLLGRHPTSRQFTRKAALPHLHVDRASCGIESCFLGVSAPLTSVLLWLLWLSYVHNYSCLSICPLREVSGNNLILRHKMLYIWPSSVRIRTRWSLWTAVIVLATGTNTRIECTKKIGNNVHLHVVACS